MLMWKSKMRKKKRKKPPVPNRTLSVTQATHVRKGYRENLNIIPKDSVQWSNNYSHVS